MGGLGSIRRSREGGNLEAGAGLFQLPQER